MHTFSIVDPQWLMIEALSPEPTRRGRLDCSHWRAKVVVVALLVGACCQRPPVPSNVNDACDPELQACGFGMACVYQESADYFGCAIPCSSDCDCPERGPYGTWQCGTTGYC